MNIGLYASVAGLLNSQRAVDIASHNIANAETEGFSRQRGQSSAALPLMRAAIGNVGTGVQLDQINRVRDMLLDRQVRTENTRLGEFEARSEAMQRLEQALGEPGETALSARIASYFDAWQRVSTNPDSDGFRMALRDAAVSMTETFNRLNTDLEALRTELTDRATTVVADINQKAQQIADLNGEIIATLVQGQQPNDLMDQRDLLIDQLSKLVKVQVVEVASSGALNVYVGNLPLVADKNAYALGSVQVSAADRATVSFEKSGFAATIQGGELKALLDVRNDTMSKLAPVNGAADGALFRLHQLAAYIIEDTNPIHISGFDRFGQPGAALFTGNDAANIAVSSTILTDATDGSGKNGFDLIAVAARDQNVPDGGKGDNETATKIIARRYVSLVSRESPTTTPIPEGAKTFEDYWQITASSVALSTQSLGRSVTTQTSLVQVAMERRDSVSAVSTDEEMANVIRYQKAYAASARMITTIDQMLDLLVNLGSR